jgi:hypothetical protein
MVAVTFDARESLLAYAAGELRDLLGPQVREEIVLNPGKPPRFRIELAVGGGVEGPEGYSATCDAARIRIEGSDPKGALNGVYAVLARLGFLFDIAGTKPPDGAIELGKEAFTLRSRPDFRLRGVRMHMNFTMDQSGYSLAQLREYVDCVARMRLNYIALHLYPELPWLDWHFRTVADRSGTFFGGEVHPVPPQPGVREKIGNKEFFISPEIEGSMRDRDAVYRHGRDMYLEIIRHAHRRGIRVCMSLEILPFSADFLEEVKRRLRVTRITREFYLELVEARFDAVLEVYREADEFQFITQETGSLLLPDTDPLQEIERFSAQYGFPPAWTKRVLARAGKEGWFGRIVASALQTAEICRTLFARIKSLDPVFSIYNTLPDRMNAILEVVPRVLAPFRKLHLLAGYGAYEVAKFIEAWKPFVGDVDLGLVTWIQFDGLMYLVQNSVESWAKGVECARRYGATCAYFNHWSRTSLDVVSAYAAEKMWDTSLTPDAFYRRHLGALYGEADIDLAVDIQVRIERATEFMTEKLFNLGFSSAGWFSMKHRYGPEDIPILDWWTEEGVDRASGMLDDVRERLRKLKGTVTTSRGRRHVDVLANRVECSLLQLKAVRSLVTFRRTQDPSAETLRKLQAEQRAASEEYLARYAEVVEDRSDEGMMASYYRVMLSNEYMYLPAREPGKG